MKESENKKTTVRITDGSSSEASSVLEESPKNKAEKLKKPVIFALMAVVFLGCMYLIFKPREDKKKTEEIGLNDAVPQASDADLQADKQKAYEQEMLEKKNQEKQNALTSLSDYWNEGNPKSVADNFDDQEAYGFNGSNQRANPALNSYRNAQNTLSSFYSHENSETQELRKQLDELREQLAQKDVHQPDPVETQLALMEKSYEMASKYLPSANGSNLAEQPKTEVMPAVGASGSQKANFVAFAPTRKTAVSSLYREPSDSTFLANWSENRNRGFYTAGVSQQIIQPKNSIKAVIQETQVVTGESGVRLRLLEAAKIPEHTIPSGTVLTANVKYQQGRLQLEINSIELDGNIIPVAITIYDLDGQQGLYVPYSPEINALTEMAGNMSQQSGTSLMLSNSAGQQIAADLSRGVVQGISGYFSKKVRTPKVTLKSGHQVFLVSKK